MPLNSTIPYRGSAAKFDFYWADGDSAQRAVRQLKSLAEPPGSSVLPLDAQTAGSPNPQKKANKETSEIKLGS